MRDPAYQQVLDDLDSAARDLIRVVVAAGRKEARGAWKGTKKRARIAERLMRHRRRFFYAWGLLPENRAARRGAYRYVERVAKEMQVPAPTRTRALFGGEN
jgi:hypothetical protein